MFSGRSKVLAFYMRRRDATEAESTLISFIDLNAFAKFVREVGEVTIEADEDHTKPMLLLTPEKCFG